MNRHEKHSIAKHNSIAVNTTPPPKGASQRGSGQWAACDQEPARTTDMENYCYYFCSHDNILYSRHSFIYGRTRHIRGGECY